MTRLLIVACSQRKKPCRQPLPAIERYDGPTFRVLRKFLRERRGPMTRILILSGKYGLIGARKRIRDYDLRMTPAIAEGLRPAVLKRLLKALRAGPVHRVGLCLGRDYSKAVRGLEAQLPEGVTVEVIGGGLGRRLTKLREWLYCARPDHDASDGEHRGDSRANDRARPRASEQ